MQTVSCNCGFKDEYEPDEFGLSYYQAVGTCPICGADLGTAEVIVFRHENGQPHNAEESPVSSQQPNTAIPLDIKEKFSKFVDEQVSLPSIFADVVNEHFWDLL